MERTPQRRMYEIMDGMYNFVTEGLKKKGNLVKKDKGQGQFFDKYICDFNLDCSP